MIAIVNISKKVGPGMQDYEIRINREVIAKFKHRRSDGLAKCLYLAAQAVNDKNNLKTNEFLTYLEDASRIVGTWPEWKRNILGSRKKSKVIK